MGYSHDIVMVSIDLDYTQIIYLYPGYRTRPGGNHRMMIRNDPGNGLSHHLMAWPIRTRIQTLQEMTDRSSLQIVTDLTYNGNNLVPGAGNILHVT